VIIYLKKRNSLGLDYYVVDYM